MQKRLFALCDALEMSRRQFSKSVGQSAAYLGNLKDDITVGVLNNILATYPQVNMVWLVKGEGEMFIQEPLKEDLSSYIIQENKELKKENKELYAEVVLLRNQIKRMEENGTLLDEYEELFSYQDKLDWIGGEENLDNNGIDVTLRGVVGLHDKSDSEQREPEFGYNVSYNIFRGISGRSMDEDGNYDPDGLGDTPYIKVSVNVIRLADDEPTVVGASVPKN